MASDTTPGTPPPQVPIPAQQDARQKLSAAAGTYLRAVLAAALASVLTVFTTTGHFPSDGKEWLALLWAVLLAVLPVVINFLNPNDQRYGRGS
ncbi:MAG TPA: hypothetical protein VI248_17755 [Kineosporiaceae bacterium]